MRETGKSFRTILRALAAASGGSNAVYITGHLKEAQRMLGVANDLCKVYLTNTAWTVDWPGYELKILDGNRIVGRIMFFSIESYHRRTEKLMGIKDLEIYDDQWD